MTTLSTTDSNHKVRPVPGDPDEIFVRSKAASYLVGLLGHGVPLSGPCIAMTLYADGCPCDEYSKMLLALLPAKQRPEASKRLKQNSCSIVSYSSVAASLVAEMTALGQNSVRTFLLERMEKVSCQCHEFTEAGLKKTLASLKDMFRLDNNETELVLFLFLYENWSYMQCFLENELSIGRYSSFNLIAQCLGISRAGLAAALAGQLKKLGIIEEMFTGISLSKYFLTNIANPSPDGIASKYFTIAKKPDFDGACEYIHQDKTQHILGLLQAKIINNGATHILLYGVPGTGKTSFARWVAQELGIPAYEVTHSTDKDANRFTGVMAALNVGVGALVIVDEADGLLNTEDGFLFSGSSQDKGVLNSVLDRPCSRVLWLSNRIDGIDQSTLRRFSYSVKFEKLGKAEREQVWGVVLHRHQATKLMPTGDVENLAQEYAVSPGVIDTVVSKASMLAKESPKEFMTAVRTGLEAHLVLTGNGPSRTRRIGF